MIDINELRQSLGAIRPEEVAELLDRLEAAEKERDFAKAEIARLHDDIRELTDVRVLDEKLGSELNAVAKERDDAKAAAENIALKLDYLRSKLETAKDAQNDWLRANAPGGWIDNLRIENEALRAKVARMEKQVPICRAEDLKHAESPLPTLGLKSESPLYALPGAQTQGEEK